MENISLNSDVNTPISYFKDKVQEFIEARNWSKYHTPKNLALSLMEDMAFEIAGTVEEVLVEEGDSVEEGQVLARLDTSEWDKELTNLEMDLVQADINLRNAELALEQAEEPYSDEDIESAEADVDSAELALDYAEEQLDEAYDSGDAGEILQAKSNVIKAEANLASAEAKLEEMEDAPDPGA